MRGSIDREREFIQVAGMMNTRPAVRSGSREWDRRAGFVLSSQSSIHNHRFRSSIPDWSSQLLLERISTPPRTHPRAYASQTFIQDPVLYPMVLDAGFVIHVERAVRRSFRIPASSSLRYILRMFCYTAALERPSSLRRGRARYGEAELATERPNPLRKRLDATLFESCSRASPFPMPMGTP